MNYLCKGSSIEIRKMKDCDADYNLMVSWLSNPVVLKYYEGVKNVFDIKKVLDKFRPKVIGESLVVACIIEIHKSPAGYIQYFPINSNEDYDLKDELIVDISKNNYGIDLFIADDGDRNKGYGTEILQLLLGYLFEQKDADEVFIDPQTWNERAIKCYEKCGFKPIKVIKKREITDGELMDSLIMSIKRS